MLKKIAEFWRNNKKVIVTVIGLTAAAPYAPILIPLADIAAEQIEAGGSQPGQSQGEGK